MLGGALPYAPATEAPAPAAPECKWKLESPQLKPFRFPQRLKTTYEIEMDKARTKWTVSMGRPTLSRRCWWWRCWFFALLENSMFEPSLEISTPQALAWYCFFLLFQSISICFTWYRPGVLVTFHFIQHPTRKTHQTGSCKISTWIISKKWWTRSMTSRSLMCMFHVFFHMISMFLLANSVQICSKDLSSVPPPNHLLDHRPLQDFSLVSTSPSESPLGVAPWRWKNLGLHTAGGLLLGSRSKSSFPEKRKS